MEYTAQIGLVPHPYTPAEYLIEWVTVSPVHHAVLGIDEEWCMSAEPGGVRVRKISRYPDAHWSNFTLTDTQRATIVSYGTDKLDEAYGWFADVAIGLAKITKLGTPQWIQRYISSQKRTECAQLCDAAFTAADIHLFSGVVPAAVSPGMLLDVFREHGFVK